MRVLSTSAVGMASAVVLAGLSGAALAEVPKEVSSIDGAKVTFYVQPFLDEAELFTLRLVATQSQALKYFVPIGKGYAAIALSPDDGFIKAGVPAPSASAAFEEPDAATASLKALEMCNAARKGPSDCVIVMEISPPN
jgi:hypothetical protein